MGFDSPPGSNAANDRRKEDGNMKFVDLSQNPPAEVTVLTLRDIAFKINGNDASTYSGYARVSVLQNWHDDPEIETPAPDYTISEVDYWLPERVSEWDMLYSNEIQREEDRKAERLKKEKISKSDLIETLLDQAKDVERRNSRCYNHNRGNSMQDGRKRVLALEGAKDFVESMLGESSMTKEQRTKWNELLSQAKAHVKMQ
ncbi:hypothetical protein HWC80_gp053 [Mycobacterium phage Indlulamithi]|uniref:Uncharacterized protein n=1 Tax=Mycobacterium phage Indlulamithi TaxID=2656582 RepID=A0A649VE86_9CAUD|nr:hypothetical protein HWC80_gp053 [Mycobacterium phage Indlulamithi]QGJ90093.1 hypothetical protein PBI_INDLULAMITHI_53 [Mycobacterium phage Indlulamithi]